MKLSKACKTLKKALPIILSVGAVIGVGITAYESGKAAIELDKTEIPEDMPKKEVVKRVSKVVWKAVVAGTLTSACIIGACALNERQKASLAGLAMSSIEMINIQRRHMTAEQIEEANEEYRKLHEEKAESKEKDKFHGEQWFELCMNPPTDEDPLKICFRADVLDVSEQMFNLNYEFATNGAAWLYEHFLLPLGVKLEYIPHISEYVWDAGYVYDSCWEYFILYRLDWVENDNELGPHWRMIFNIDPTRGWED